MPRRKDVEQKGWSEGEKEEVRKAAMEKQISAWIHSKMFGTSVHDDTHVQSANHTAAESTGKLVDVFNMEKRLNRIKIFCNKIIIQLQRKI